MRSNSPQNRLESRAPGQAGTCSHEGDGKRKSRIPTNASENGGGETAGHNGELLIANDFLVARLGLGTMRLTGKGIWGEPADRNEAIRVVRRAAELGVNFFDTADSYGPYVRRLIEFKLSTS